MSVNDQKPEASKGLERPVNRMIGAISLEQAGGMVRALAEAGYAPIEIMAGEGAKRRLSATEGGDGIGGMFRRLLQTTGFEHDFLLAAQKEIEDGHALVGVEIDGTDEEKRRVHAIMAEQGGHNIAYVGRWALERLPSRPNPPQTAT